MREEMRWRLSAVAERACSCGAAAKGGRVKGTRAVFARTSASG
jgi:hypothetical protein